MGTAIDTARSLGRGDPGGRHVAYRAVLLAAALIVAGLVFHQLVTLVLAVVITVIVAIPMSALATRLERHRVPRAVGALIALLIALAVIAGVVALVIPSFVGEVNQFVDSLPGIIASIEGKIRHLTGSPPGQITARAQHFLRSYTTHPQKLLGPIASIGFGVAGALGALILILLTALYIAINPRPLVDGALRLFPPPRRARAEEVMLRVRAAWIGWLRGLAIAMVIVGVLLYVGLTLVGLKFAIFFAVLSAVAVVVPYFGAIATGIPPVLFGLTYSPGKALAVLGIYVLAHIVEGDIVEPLVMARAVKLHPALIGVGVVVVQELFGFLGLVVAVPILTATTILVEEVWVKPLERDTVPVDGELAVGDAIEGPAGGVPAPAGPSR